MAGAFDHPRIERDDPKSGRASDHFVATTAGPTAWTAEQATAARGVLPEWPSRFEFDDVRAAKPDFQPSDDRTIVFNLRGAMLTMLGRAEDDATWFRLKVEPKPGGSTPTTKPVAGDPWIPDWSDFAKRVDGWEFKLPSWREAQLARLRSDKPEVQAAPEPDMEGKDRLPPQSGGPMR